MRFQQKSLSRQSFTHAAVAFSLVCCAASGSAWAGPGDVVINELLYNADPTNTGGEFLELYNAGDTAADLSGWELSDAIMFTFPGGTQLAPGEFLVLARNAEESREFYGVDIAGQYEGRLNNTGETVFLHDASVPKVEIDTVTYDDADPWPLEADGGGPSLELVDPASDNSDPASWALGQSYSPGAANEPVFANSGDIVISEIQYKPQREEFRREFDRVTQSSYWEDGDDVFGEYVELYNRSEEVVDLTGWHFSDGFTFAFPDGGSIAPGAYVIVSSDPGVMSTRYGLTNIIGKFEGTLSNNGERITLRDAMDSVVDTVRYNDKHPWPISPDDSGVSLECIDLLEDNGSAANWRASRAEFPPPFAASPLEDGWQFLTVSGSAPSDNLYVYLLDGAGEWLVDDIRLTESGKDENLLPNGSFEVDEMPWLKTGSHAESFRTTDDAHDGTACVHIVATGRGGGPANSFYMKDVPGIVVDQPYVLSAWVKFLSGEKRLGIRFTSSGLGVNADAPQSLAADWSDTENPNGLWSYHDGEGAVIPSLLTNWRTQDLGPKQPAWSADDDSSGWARSVGGAADLDFPVGSVAAMGPAEIWWTADDDGLVRVGGGAWLLRHSGEPQTWYVTKNSNVITEGELIPGETEFTSANPKSFDTGTRGAQVLTVEVEEDDVIKIGTRATGANDFVGFDLNVRFGISEPDPPVGGVLGNGTPGQINSVTGAIPPFIRELEHFPALPTSADTVLITTRVSAFGGHSVTSVQLETSLRTGTNEEMFEMFDDGQHGDLEAGDGMYGVMLEPKPSHSFVHYRVIAQDDAGEQASLPYDDDPSPTQAYYTYDGDVQTNVTFMDLFLTNGVLSKLRANPRGPDYNDGSAAINGVAYPHIGVRKRGRQSRLNPKHQWKFRFNRGALYDGLNRHIDCYLNVPDQVQWGFEVYAMGGTENLQTELLRVHVNGAFFGLYCGAESPNATWLDKRGYHRDSEIYKARVVETPNEAKNSDLYHNQIVTDEDYHGSYNKKVRPLERPTHIRELVNAVNDLRDEDLLPWIDANVDLHNWYRRWALAILMRMPDFCGHNYYMLLPSNGDGTYGKWQKMDYDFDHGFNPSNNLRATYGDGVGGIPGWQRNKFYQRTSRNPTLRRIYYLTLREMIETVFIEAVLNQKVDELFSNAAADRALDRAKWGTSKSNSSGIKSAMRGQRTSMTSFLNRQALPSSDDIPTIDPPGGMFSAPTLVTLTTTEGWTAVYTTDGTDPRLSTSRVVYTEPFMMEASGTVMAAAALDVADLASGDWTGRRDAVFEIEGSQDGVGPFIRGDCDGNGAFGGNPTEAIVLLNFSFQGGVTPPCLAACDAEANGAIGITDALRILRAAFLGTGQPDAPFPDCTTSALGTDIELGCEIPTACAN